VRSAGVGKRGAWAIVTSYNVYPADRKEWLARDTGRSEAARWRKIFWENKKISNLVLSICDAFPSWDLEFPVTVDRSLHDLRLRLRSRRRRRRLVLF
jgi:hypothetical protein